MSELTELERQVVRSLLAGDTPGLGILRDQAKSSVVTTRQITGAGFFAYLSVKGDTPRLKASSGTVRLGDVVADIGGLEHGAGFLLYVKDGALHMLEGYSFEEPWPEKIETFSLRYVNPDQRSIPSELL